MIVQVLIVGVPLLAIFLWYVQTPGQDVVRATSGSKDHVLFTSRELRRFHCFTDKAIRSWRLVLADYLARDLEVNTISNVSASDVNLVSENQTDFIFSVIGEEFWGLLDVWY